MGAQEHIATHGQAWTNHPSEFAGADNAQVIYRVELVNCAQLMAQDQAHRVQALLRHVHGALLAWLDRTGFGHRAITMGHGSVAVALPRSSPFARQRSGLSLAASLSKAVAETLRGPLPGDGQAPLPEFALSGPTLSGIDFAREPDLLALAAHGCAASEAARCESARRSMALVQTFLRELRGGEIAWLWDPVWSQRANRAAYFEPVPAHVSMNGRLSPRTEHWAGLVQLGLSRPYEQALALEAIDHLQRSPRLQLALTVPASSARRDLWWLPVLERLRGDRALAERLRIGIVADGPISAIGDVIAFLDEWRALGCPIDLVGFGGADSSLRALMVLRPHAVKLDPVLLRLAMSSPQWAEAFRHLVRLAGAVAEAVVAGGVVSAAHARIAEREGVDLQQGAYLQSPSLALPHSGDVHCAAQAAAHHALPFQSHSAQGVWL